MVDFHFMIFSSQEKKISLNKNDRLANVIECLVGVKAKKVILEVPQNSKLGLNIENFEILKKEANTKKLELVIESADDRILELATSAGLKAYHPIFGTQEKVVVDILPRQPFPLKRAEGKEIKLKEEKKEEKKIKKEVGEKEKPVALERLEAKKERPKQRLRFKWRWLLIIVSIAGLIFGGYELVVNILPKVNITLQFQKTPVDFEKNITVASQFFKINVAGADIEVPGELLIFKQNTQLTQPASGKEEVVVKASGRLVIFNAYSSQPQVLVAGTRFQSPEGKIFKLTDRMTIPGAEIINGEIKPSQIEVSVIADQAGADYNLSPTSWRIIGFKGTPKYEKIYAQSTKSMSGGFTGEKPVPTSADIDKIKTNLEETLKTSLQNQMIMTSADKFKILEGASDFKMPKEEVSSQADEQGNFSIFGEAQQRYLVFEESTLKEALVQKIKSENINGIDVKILEFNFDYREIKADFEQKKMDFKVKGRIVFAPVFEPQIFKNQIANLDEKSLRSLLSSLSQLENAKISFWPFWVNHVPQNSGNIEINVE